MSTDPLTATAVICTRNRVEDLRRALASLAWQTRAFDQIVVVDDSDPHVHPAVLDACTAAGVDVEVLRKDEPGLTVSRNLAIDHSEGDVTMFFDDDVVLHPRYVERMLHVFASSPEVVGAGGSIDDDHEYGWQWLRALLMVPGRKSGRVYRSGWSSQAPRSRSGPVEHLIGCNMAYRTDVLRSHRFSPEFRGYALCEDLELSHRLHLEGHRLVSVGDARCWHLTTLGRHDRAWGYREMVVRPIVARQRFNRVAFLVSASTFLAVNAIRNRERAAGNVQGIVDVLRRRPPRPVHTLAKPNARTYETARPDAHDGVG